MPIDDLDDHREELVEQRDDLPGRTGRRQPGGSDEVHGVAGQLAVGHRLHLMAPLVKQAHDDLDESRIVVHHK
ncbi:hypothetical protein ABZ801_34890 [Actinomadura sp. NPDC047616]|uniref:hypothetical protein n=1 Tax=Actinomadura sp. NPDC047616 TaxID=3155914 RepID=UPI00340D045D